MRFGEVSPIEGMPPITEEDKNLIMHIELPIVGGHMLMGTDAPESFGFSVNFGNNGHIKKQLKNDYFKKDVICLISIFFIHKVITTTLTNTFLTFQDIVVLRLRFLPCILFVYDQLLK